MVLTKALAQALAILTSAVVAIALLQQVLAVCYYC